MQILETLASACIMLSMASAVSHAQSVYYVTPDMHPKHPATFTSLHEALDSAARDSNDVVIYMRDGNHVIDRPVILTPAHGNDHKSLTIRSYPGEHAVLSAGLPLRLEWKKYRDGIMRADVPGNPVMDMLIVNGEIRHMARYPDFDPDAVRFNGTSAMATAPERVKK